MKNFLIFTLSVLLIIISAHFAEAQALRILEVRQGGTGLGAIQSNTLLIGNGTSNLSTTTSGTDGFVLGLSAGVPTWLSTSTIGAADPNVIITGGFLRASTTGNVWLFPDGFISQASSTVSVGGLNIQGAFNASSTSFFSATSTFLSRMNIGTTSPHQAATVNIEVQNAGDHGIKITGASGQSEHLFSIENNAGRELLTVGEDGDLEIDHFEDAAGSGAFHIDNDINNFPDVSAIVINQILTGLQSEESSIGVSLVADTADSASNSSFEGFGCFSVGTGSVTLDCLAAGVGFNVIHQDSGVRADPSFVFTASSTFTTFTDITAAAISASNDIQIFPVDDDYLVIGFTSQFGEISIDLNTPSGRSIFQTVDTFEHSATGDTWIGFGPNDLTDGLTENGIVRMDVEDIGDDWTTATVNGQGSIFWIRFQRTRNNIQTTPIENLIQISTVTEYGWNLIGNINNSNVYASSTVQATGNILGYANLGIGTTSPSFPLSIQGNALFSGNLIGANFTATGTLAVTGTATFTGDVVITSGTLRIPNSADPTVDTAGKIAVDTTAASTSLLWHDGTAERIISATTTKSFVLTSADGSSGKDFMWRVHERIEILGMDCIVDPEDTTGKDIDIEYFRTDSNGDSTTTLDAIIQCNNTTTFDDGSLTISIIEANTYMGIHIGTASGTINMLSSSYRSRLANP